MALPGTNHDDRNRLLVYFENELQTLRRLSDEFVRNHQDEAERLLLKEGRCDDPHVERLIESVALLTARVQMRLDEDFPEVCETLLDLLLPEFLAPIPSLAIVQLRLGKKLRPSAVHVPRHSQALTPAIAGTRCRFRTCYPVDLWPLEVARVDFVSIDELRLAAKGGAKSALRIGLQALGGLPLAAMDVRRLSFYLDGEWSLVSRLYDVLLQEPLGVAVRPDARTPATLLQEAQVRALGFERDESLFGIRRRSAAGHRLLLEHFAFPEKFMFVALEGLAGMCRGAQQSVELLVLLDHAIDEVQHMRIGPGNLKLGCTPVENLFRVRPDPIVLNEAEPEFQVVPDARARQHHEVYSVLGVKARARGSGHELPLLPFYASQQAQVPSAGAAYWHQRRRQAASGPLTETFLAIVDRDHHPVLPEGMEVLVVDALCTNGDLPATEGLPWGRASDLELEGFPDVAAIQCLKGPTRSLRRNLGRDSRWQLASTLTLNHLSLDSTDADDVDQSRLALQQILAMFDCRKTEATQRRRSSLIGVEARRVSRLVGDAGLMRGLSMTLRFDAEKVSGSSLVLYGSVLDRFLGLQASVNSFVQCRAVLGDDSTAVKTWPARLGGRRIL